jgi:hypothetical protein
MINQYTIYGERHSGTNFLENFINQSFRLSLTYQYGHKHFFTPYHIDNLDINHKTGFFCIVRNPYDWLVAMYKKPYHCGFSYGSFYDFLNHQWWSRQDFVGVEIYEDRNWISGQRYSNIFELRKNKIKYLYDLKMYNKYLLQFENFLNLKTTLYIKQNIASQFKISSYEHKIIFKPQKLHYLSIDTNIFSLINNSIDWELEALLGYYPFDTYKDFFESYSILTGNRDVIP